MIETLAKAMCDGDWNAKSFNETPNGEEPEDLREYWREKARDALRALREPDAKMMLAGVKAESYRSLGSLKVRQIWNGMIRAALDDKPA